tara:strand:+ start:5236 stop:5685 length:450 start_codon:yes stop_codon:yes gene_type:complete
MPNFDLSGLPDPESDPQFYAGVPFKRLLAWFIDFFVIVILTLGASIATLGILAVLFPLTLLVINIGYRIYFLQLKSATPGMMLVGIEIRNHMGNRLTLRESFWHTIVFTLAIMTFVVNALSMIMMLVSRHHQGVHDYLCGTTAINRPMK